MIDKYIRIKSYITENNLKSNYIEIIKFNKNSNNFDIITDNNILQTCIDNLFRYFYNTRNKTIEHGAIKIYTQYILIEYNTCNKIEKIDQRDGVFSFANFNIPNITIGNYNNLLDETKITKLDNERENYYNDITANLSISRNNANSIIVNTEQKITAGEEDLKKLKNNNKITFDFLNNETDNLKIQEKLLANSISKCDTIPNTFFNSKRRDDQKITCNNDQIPIENKIIELHRKINQYNLQIAENKSYQNSTQNGINILKNTLKYQKKIYGDIETLLQSFNRKYTLKDINDRIKDKNILNTENYINNISNDDCIYIKII